MYSIEKDNQQEHLINQMIIHNRSVLSEPGFPNDASLKFGRELDSVEVNKKAGTPLDEIEVALTRISDDIEQFYSVNQSEPDRNTNQPGVVQRITRIFSGILR